jgi:hypothetical protein
LAVPGPFKRIARAGGQKVTIRIAQRRFFKNSSDAQNYFFDAGVTIFGSGQSAGNTGISTL